MKKWLRVLLAAVMLLAMAGIAMAADEATGKIEFTNTVSGESVTAYKIIEYEFDTTTGQYTNAKWVPAVKSWIEKTYGEISVDEISDALKAQSVTETAFYEGIRKNVTLTEEADLSNLRAGSYICLISGGTTVHQLHLVSLSPKQDDATGEWSLDVNGELDATTKSSRPQLDKTMTVGTKNTVQDHDTVAIGDKVTFDIYASVPTYPDDATNTTYTITDTMAQGLTNNQDVEVTLIRDGKTLTAGTDYKIDYHSNDQGFTIKFDYALIKSEAINTVSTWNEGAGGEYKGRVDTITGGMLLSGVHIRYTATINENVQIQSDGNTNEARLEYSNNPYGDSTSGIKDEVKVYTYGLKIDKVDGKDSVTKLSGAKFTINKKGNPDNLSFVADAANPGQYTVVKAGTTGAVTEIETPTSGEIQIKGLDVGEYELKETKAPEGYNKLTNSVEFTIAKDETQHKMIKDTNSAYIQQTIKNYKGIIVPSTGGMGTTIFMVVGIAVMACAVVALMIVLKRQKHGEA